METPTLPIKKCANPKCNREHSEPSRFCSATCFNQWYIEKQAMILNLALDAIFN